MSVDNDWLPHSSAGARGSGVNVGFNKMNFFQQLTNMLGVLPNNPQNLTGSVPDVGNQSSQTFETYTFQIDRVKEMAETIALDVVLNFDIVNPKKAPNSHCKTMRRCVKELSIRHDIVFKGMINKLKPNDENFFSTFVMVADEIFQDGHINWGRIVSVYCFASRIVKYTKEHTVGHSQERRIASFVGKYVGNKLSQWILEHGGWDAFVEFFPDQGQFEETLWKGLLFTAIGFGALATMVVSR